DRTIQTSSTVQGRLPRIQHQRVWTCARLLVCCRSHRRENRLRVAYCGSEMRWTTTTLVDGMRNNSPGLRVSRQRTYDACSGPHSVKRHMLTCVPVVLKEHAISYVRRRWR